MYPNDFVSELRSLPKNKQFIFGLCNSERLLHFYKSFEEEWEVNQPFALLTSALELGYNYAAGGNQVTFLDLAQAMINVEKSIPDNDEYDGSALVTYAQNASLALYCTLKYLVKDKPASLLEACGKTVDTIDAIALNQANDESFNTNPIIDREIALQLDYLEYINTMILSDEGVVKLRQINQENRIIS